ncbi:MAG: hypothetical protein ABH827_01385 [bacterium]
MIDAPIVDGGGGIIEQTKDEVLQSFIDINDDARTKTCFYHINQKLWEYLQKQDQDLSSVKLATLFADKNEAKRIISVLISQAKKLDREKRYAYVEILHNAYIPEQKETYDQQYGVDDVIGYLSAPSARSLFFDILQKELDAKKNNKALLYRGIKTHQAPVMIKESKERTVLERPVLDKPVRFTGSEKSLEYLKIKTLARFRYL